MAPTEYEARPARLTPALAVLVALVCAGAACSNDSPSGPDSAPMVSPLPTPEPGSSLGASRVLYVQRGRLELFDVRSRRRTKVARIPSLDVTASAVSPWVAYVSGRGVVGDDFVEHPELRLVHSGTGRRLDLGPGFSPMWHPSSARLAWLRPTEDRRCDAEVCEGGSEIVVADASSGRPRVVLGGGQWVLLTWAGDHLIVSDSNAPDGSLAVGPSGRTSRLEVPAAEVWEASPDGTWLVTTSAGAAHFLRLQDGVVKGTEVTVDLAGAILGEGSWAPDSSRLAAALRVRGRSHLVMFSPQAPDPRPIRGAPGVLGDVMWAGHGKALATTRVTDSGRRLQGLYCRIQGARPCRGLFSWIQDVVLLRVQ